MEAVVNRPSLRVGEDVVGLVDLRHGLGVRVGPVVRVVDLGKCGLGRLHDLSRGGSRHPQDVVSGAFHQRVSLLIGLTGALQVVVHPTQGRRQ